VSKNYRLPHNLRCTLPGYAFKLFVRKDYKINQLLENLHRPAFIHIYLSDLDEETQLALALSASMAPPPPPATQIRKGGRGRGKKNQG